MIGQLEILPKFRPPLLNLQPQQFIFKEGILSLPHQLFVSPTSINIYQEETWDECGKFMPEDLMKCLYRLSIATRFRSQSLSRSSSLCNTYLLSCLN